MLEESNATFITMIWTDSVIVLHQIIYFFGADFLLKDSAWIYSGTDSDFLIISIIVNCDF